MAIADYLLQHLILFSTNLKVSTLAMQIPNR